MNLGKLTIVALTFSTLAFAADPTAPTHLVHLAKVRIGGATRVAVVDNNCSWVERRHFRKLRYREGYFTANDGRSIVLQKPASASNVFRVSAGVGPFAGWIGSIRDRAFWLPFGCRRLA